jgi:protein-disulfide isomerase-like protein with CxxC motif
MTRSFQITFDYLCPFARNANEHVVEGLRAGADWNVRFLPFSLAQGHVEEGEQAVWDRDEPNTASGVLALQVGLTVRDHHTDHFLDVHQALFAARHDEGHDIKDPVVLRDVLTTAGLSADEVFDHIDHGAALDALRTEHTEAVDKHQVWGVPTFITDRRAVFVRLMDRPERDGALATRRIDHVVDLVDTPIELHEFKQVDLPM